MEVKGTAFIARKQMIETTRGAAAWSGFLQRLRAKESFYNVPVLPVTLIPVRSFLCANNLIIQDFFAGDPRANWRMGEASAEWALMQGPLKTMMGNRSFARFANTGPAIWQAYYTAGTCHVEVKQSAVEVFIDGVPVPDVYFEYGVLGYYKRGLELASGGAIECTKRKGFSSGDAHVHYTLEVR